MDKTKPYFRRKGFYKDGRRRIIVEWSVDRWTKKSIALPKPEILLKLLDAKKRTKTTREKSK